MKVILINKPYAMLELMYVAARTCYSAKAPSEMWGEILDDTIKEDYHAPEKFLDKVLSSGHTSIAEHINFTFAIDGISRACSHQLVRHRHACYCLAGDTVIKQRSHGESRTIKELYDSTSQYNKMRRIRCVNETTRELQYDPIKEVIYSGKKPVYEVTTNFGYKIKSTMQHRFFTQEGWKRLEELSVGDTVYVNGAVAYKDKEWLNKQYNVLNKSQEEIAELCGASKHTIRKWVRKYNLQKDLGSWCIGKEPINKGRTKNDYEPMLRTSKKMMGNTNSPALYGENNPMWRGDNVGLSGGYLRTHRSNKTIGICSNCGTSGYTELHHIDKNPTNANSSNIMELCRCCHKAIHKKEIKEVVIPNTITSIEYIGIVDTYDISMAGDNHNFIANGFVVHNSQQSQRYVEIKESQSELYDLVHGFPTDEKIAKMKELASKYFVDSDDGNYYGYVHCLWQYTNRIECGEKPEDARSILPNAMKTNLVMTCNLRELMHICNLRLCTRAQKEIRELVKRMRDELVEVEPFLDKYLQPKCEQLGFCTEHQCCGRKPKLDTIQVKS